MPADENWRHCLPLLHSSQSRVNWELGGSKLVTGTTPTAKCLWVITRKLCFIRLEYSRSPLQPFWPFEPNSSLYWVNVSRTLYNVVPFPYRYFTALIVWSSCNFGSCMDPLQPHQLSDSFHYSRIIFLGEKIAKAAQSYLGRNLSNFQQLNGFWIDFLMLESLAGTISLGEQRKAHSKSVLGQCPEGY